MPSGWWYSVASITPPPAWSECQPWARQGGCQYAQGAARQDACRSRPIRAGSAVSRSGKAQPVPWEHRGGFLVPVVGTVMQVFAGVQTYRLSLFAMPINVLFNQRKSTSTKVAATLSKVALSARFQAFVGCCKSKLDGRFGNACFVFMALQ